MRRAPPAADLFAMADANAWWCHVFTAERCRAMLAAGFSALFERQRVRMIGQPLLKIRMGSTPFRRRANDNRKAR